MCCVQYVYAGLSRTTDLAPQAILPTCNTLRDSACMPDNMLVKPQECPALAAASGKLCVLCAGRAGSGTSPERHILSVIIGSQSQTAP